MTMPEKIVYEFDKICRTCLSSYTENEMEMQSLNNSIKTAEKNILVIGEMLISCARIEISDDDHLPAQICLRCLRKLQEAYAFQQRCKKNDATLRRHIVTNSSRTDTHASNSTTERTHVEPTKNNTTIQDRNNSMDVTDVHVDVMHTCRTMPDFVDPEQNRNVNSFKTIDAAKPKPYQTDLVDVLEDNIINVYQKDNTELSKHNYIDNIMIPKKCKEKRIAPKQTSLVSHVSVVAPDGNIHKLRVRPGKYLKFNPASNDIIIGNKKSKLIPLLPQNTSSYVQSAVCSKFGSKMCEQRFNKEVALSAHANRAQSLEEMDYLRCKLCNVAFASYDKLNEHNLVNHIRYSLKCDTCGVVFANKQLLNRHRRTTHHLVVGGLGCDKCNKRFDSLKGLSIHKTFHNAQKNGKKVVCEICDRSFNIPSNLTYHMKYHKANICSYCNHGFCDLDTLKFHMKSEHSAAKPYVCNYCYKKFSERKILLRHKRSSHQVFKDVYFCGICKNDNVGFVESTFLSKHIEKYHKIHNDINVDYSTLHPITPQPDLDNESEYLIADRLNEKGNEIPKATGSQLHTGNFIDNNLSELIEYTDHVNKSNLIMYPDGTINIQINESDEDPVLSEADDCAYHVNNTDIKKEAFLNDTNILDSYITGAQALEECYSHVKEYDLIQQNDISVENTKSENEEQQCVSMKVLNENLLNGKIVHYDSEHQQYMITFNNQYNIKEAVCLEIQEYLEEKFDNGTTENLHVEMLERKKSNGAIDQSLCVLMCKYCKLTFTDQAVYSAHTMQHDDLAKMLLNLKSNEAKAVENSDDIKDGMVRFTQNKSGIIEQIKTDLIFDTMDYTKTEDRLSQNKVLQQYKCPKCTEVYTRQYSLTRHLAHVHNDKCLMCNTCGEGFNRALELETHRRLHSEQNNGAMTETNNAVQIISSCGNICETKVKPEVTYHCVLCKKSFRNRINLEKHRAQHVNSPDVNYVCSVCNENFKNLLQFYKHKRIHGEEYIQCNLCDKRFTTIGGLKYHLKTHTGAKNYSCPFCGKKFTANVNLNAHIKSIHSEIKPHLCVICSNRYSTRDHLRKHMVKHTGDRRFLCNICGRSFSQSSHLTQHSWIHSGVKPYECKRCDNKYTSSSALKKHVLNNHRSAEQIAAHQTNQYL